MQQLLALVLKYTTKSTANNVLALARPAARPRARAEAQRRRSRGTLRAQASCEERIRVLVHLVQALLELALVEPRLEANQSMCGWLVERCQHHGARPGGALKLR